ncbi:putative Solute carrier family 35 member F6 [Blattamonas nauphoetae]|uniref:Solute carrier family 35 member F6 n=1 Tax=Blattamonas nauphoetae TaxID=2049346 RepID=A0ABQ9XCL6_9EUKA|nr:putative Solute carrier family 35 member F6 [Blattamonas nauphoetae]
MKPAVIVKTAFCIAGFLLFGAGNSILGKMMLNSRSPNIYGVETPFAKPWFQNWGMFTGMAMVIFVELISSCVRRIARRGKSAVERQEQEPLLSSETAIVKKEKSSKFIYVKILAPAMCDVIATIMMNAALVSIPVSIWQMLRGSIIIFTAILTVCYRRKPLNCMNWVGVGIVVGGLVVLGVSAVIGDPESKDVTVGKVILGVVLVVLAQGVQGFQTIVEEQFLHDSSTPPMQIVAFEGIWGFLFATFFFMPICYFIPGEPGNGLTEDFADAWVMIANDPLIVVWTVCYMTSILMFNITGMFIIEVTSALTRNVLEPLRTMIVWIASLIQYYASGGIYGEKWTPLSFLQLGGFILITIGVFTYNQIWAMCCKKKAAETVEE